MENMTSDVSVLVNMNADLDETAARDLMEVQLMLVGGGNGEVTLS